MLSDIRYAFRGLRNNRGLALTAIVSIGLAIGANSSVFSFLDALVLRPLPVPEPSQVVSLRSMEPAASGSTLVNLNGLMSYPDYVEFRNRSQSFDGLVAFETIPAGFARDANAQPQFRMGHLVTGNFFGVLKVQPELGRDFRPEEDEVPGRDAVIVLSHNLWKQEFAADPSVIGRSIKLSGLDFAVVGVAPESFTNVDRFIRPDFFIPAMMAARMPLEGGILTDRARRGFDVKGRLKKGVSLESAIQEAGALAKSLEQVYPATNHAVGATVRTEMQVRFDTTPTYRSVVGALFTLVAIVLLIGCANVANLMLGRSRFRVREIAVRLAIGASRARLIRQLMAESLLIALAGGALGIAIAQGVVKFFSTIQVVSDAPVRLSFQVDVRVLFFTLLISLTSALLFGLAPALQATRTDLAPALKAGEVSAHRKRFLGRNVLATMQVMGSVVLIMAAVQLYRGYAVRIDGDHGFRRDHLLTMRLDPSVSGRNAQQTEQFYRTLLDRSREIPELRSAALASFLALTVDVQLKTVIPRGYESKPGSQSISVLSSTVDDHYFETLGVRILNGRGFLPTDTEASPRVAVVNDTFARKYLEGDALGKRIQLDNEKGSTVEVVGVAVTGEYLSVAEPRTEFLFLPYSQEHGPRMTLIAASSGDPARLAEPLRQLVRSIDPSLPILAVRTMDAVFEQSAVSNFRVTNAIFGAAGAMALILALVGLYAVVSYQASRRTRDIGVLMALGASRPQVMRMILRQAIVMSVVGVGAGTGLGIVIGRGLATALPTPYSALILLLPPALLLMTLLSAVIPAWRASCVDPLVALRQD